MDYKKAYLRLISRAKERRSQGLGAPPDGEKHHVIPRSMGGGNKGNIVVLSVQEHFLAHRLLAKIFGGVEWNSVVSFFTRRANGGQARYNSQTVETARKAIRQNGHRLKKWKTQMYLNNIRKKEETTDERI